MDLLDRKNKEINWIELHKIFEVVVKYKPYK